MLTRNQIVAQKAQTRNYRAEDALRMALLNPLISPQDAMRLQGVSRAFQGITNVEYQRRINEKIRGRTRLMYASQKYGEHERVRQLIRSGALRNIVSYGRRTALYYAVEAGQVENVKVLLNEPVPFAFRFRPVEPSVIHGLYELDEDGDREQIGINSFYEALTKIPEFVAVEESDNLDTAFEILRLLIAASQPTDFIQNRYLEDLFINSSSLDEYNNNTFEVVDKVLEIAKLIFEKAGDNPVRQTMYALEICIENGRTRYAKFLLEHLISKGQNINMLIWDDTTDATNPLMLVTDKNTLEMANMLIELGADVDAVTPNNTSILLYAIKTGRFPNEQANLVHFARLLLSISSNSINLVDEDQRHVLGEAFGRYRNRELIDLLIEHGADPLLALHSAVH